MKKVYCEFGILPENLAVTLEKYFGKLEADTNLVQSWDMIFHDGIYDLVFVVFEKKVEPEIDS